MSLTRAILIVSATSVLAQNPPSGSHSLALTHVTVIDVTGGRPVTNTTVVITGDRISAIGSTSTVAIPAGAQVLVSCLRNSLCTEGGEAPGWQGAKSEHVGNM